MAESNQEVVDSLVIRDILGIKNGKLKIVDAVTPNGSANVSITNVAPSAVTTSTISRWLLIDVEGAQYFIPMWT